jgi:hypothetical protein
MAGDRDACDARCLCGSLLARLIAQGVELKCRRCKRVVVLPLTAAHGARPPGASIVTKRRGGT